MTDGVYFIGKTFDEFFTELTNEILEQLKLKFELKPRTNEQKEEWLKENEACKLLKVSRPTLYSLVEEGKLNKYRIRASIVRYKLSEITNVLNGGSHA